MALPWQVQELQGSPQEPLLLREGAGPQSGSIIPARNPSVRQPCGQIAKQTVNDLLSECPAHPDKRTEALKQCFPEVRELTTEQTGPRGLVYAGITGAMFGVNGGRVQGHPVPTDNPWVQHSGLPATGQPASDPSRDSPSPLRVTLLRPTMKTPSLEQAPLDSHRSPPPGPLAHLSAS